MFLALLRSVKYQEYWKIRWVNVWQTLESVNEENIHQISEILFEILQYFISSAQNIL